MRDQDLALASIDAASLSRAELHDTRTRFAEAVTALAFECEDNAEFLSRMHGHLANSFALMGEGTTRWVYSTPLGVVIKLQRGSVIEDPIHPEELENRGGEEFLGRLSRRRRYANFQELLWSTVYPLAMPRIYGFAGAFTPHPFGMRGIEPCVLVMETACTLDRMLPEETHGVAYEDMAMDASGQLWVFDGRLTEQVRPPQLPPVLSEQTEDKVWLGNLGVTVDGRYVFVDRSHNSNSDSLRWFEPHSHTLIGWDNGAMNGLTNTERNARYSKGFLERYRLALERSTQHG